MPIGENCEKCRKELLSAVFEALPMPATLIDAQGLIVEVNQAFLEHFGRACGRSLRKEERLGRHVLQYCDSQVERARMENLLDTVLIEGEPCSLTWMFATALGATRIRGMPLRDATGQVSGGLVLREDITPAVRQQRQQQALAQVRHAVAEMRGSTDLQQVLTAIREGLQELTASFDDCGVNLVDARHTPPTVQFYSMTHEGEWLPGGAEETPQILFRIWRNRQLVYRKDLESEDPYGERESLSNFFGHSIRSLVDVPFAQGTLAVNSRLPNAFSEADLSFLEELAGALEEGVTRRNDLRALAESEARLHQAQKQEALGQLAGGVAHDFNNLLTVIVGYTQLLRRELQDPALEDLEQIFQAAERGTGLVRQLLAFCRKQVLQPKVLELNAVVHTLEKMLHRLLGEDIQLLLQLTASPDWVLADEVQLQQVLMNLVVNARDAMPTGGQVTIRTTGVELDTAGLAVDHLPPGPYLLLAVRDTGAGMGEATRRRIFEPFFTTKEPGQGTGLGLATVYGIVQQSRGAIQVDSAPGQGSTFTIYLPCVEAPASPNAPQETTDIRRRSSEATILIVEDQQEVRRLMRRILETEGYRTLEAEDGKAALRLAGEYRAPIHLLLTDVVMPEMGGRPLAETLPGLHPETRVLYVSGYAQGIIDRYGALESGTTLLKKPFTAEELLQQVEAALEDAAGNTLRL